jgi:hypothetical protein
MKYNIYDSITGIYKKSIELDYQPEFSVTGHLPEETQYYTIAYINNEWVSVVRPEYEIIDDNFVLKILN